MEVYMKKCTLLIGLLMLFCVCGCRTTSGFQESNPEARWRVEESGKVVASTESGTYRHLVQKGEGIEGVEERYNFILIGPSGFDSHLFILSFYVTKSSVVLSEITFTAEVSIESDGGEFSDMWPSFFKKILNRNSISLILDKKTVIGVEFLEQMVFSMPTRPALKFLIEKGSKFLFPL
jgi:hypothetical protein